MVVSAVKSHHFWAVTYPFFDSTLTVRTGTVEAPVKFAVYDCDGGLTHETTLRFPPQTVTVLQCETLMKLCKIESGLKHSHIIAEATSDVDIKLQLESRDWSVPLAAPIIASSGIPAFAPFVIMPERAWLAGVVNYTAIVTVVRVRAVVGAVTNESQITLQPFGVRIVSATQFADHNIWQPGFGYLKLTVRGGDERIGFQLIEGAIDESATRHYGGIG